jgi:hypothetical protein
MTASPERGDFDDFWQLYLREHCEPGVRVLHYLATVVGAGLFVWGLAWGPLWLLLLVLPAGYGLAWFGHRVFQGNNPVVASRPGKVLWGAGCDLRMCWLALTRRLAPELERAGISTGKTGGSYRAGVGG